MKIGARVLDYADGYTSSSGPKWPKCSFQAPGPKVNKFLRFHDFTGFILY